MSWLGYTPGLAHLGSLPTCCIVYYLRERRDKFGILLHGLIPFASFVLFVPVLLAALDVDFAGLDITPLAPPAYEAPYVIYGWLAAGVLILVYFLATNRARIARTGLVFEDPDVKASDTKSGEAGLDRDGREAAEEWTQHGRRTT